MNRTITAIAAGAGIAFTALVLPALGASASTLHSAAASSSLVTVVHNAASQKYSWATGFDSGSTGPSWMQEYFLIKSQSLKNRTGSIENNHSLTETYVRDAAGNAFEFGVTSDAEEATTRPTLFTATWKAGHFSGYEAGFVSASSVKPGSFHPPVGKSVEFGYWITGGKIRLTYNGKYFGYIPTSYWRGGFGAVTGAQTYGEVYNNSPGRSPAPTMNGHVSNYRTNTGSHLTSFSVSSPYRVRNAGRTGFTFSG